MTLYYQDDHVTLYHGDCMDVMASLPAESVDAIVTSPPYAMQRRNTYGGIPESEYPAWAVAWMAEARRILKPDGSAIVNLVPHISNGRLSDYVLRTRLALRASGWAEIGEMVWHKPNAMPTGSPRKPKRSWESLLWYGKHGQPYSDARANGTPATDPGRRRTSSKAERLGWGHGITRHGATASTYTMPPIARAQDVVTMSKVSHNTGFDHPASYPWQLAEWCGKLICPPGGMILDPFSGSASTGVAALRNGWNYIGIDSVEEYVEMSARRLAVEQAAFT